MEYTRKLAEFCAELSYESLPLAVAEKAKLCVLDFFANVYGSLELDAVSRVASYIRSLGGPEVATAFGCGFKTGIHHAAFLNGTSAEAIEAQDGLRFGGNHPGVSVIPAALALAEDLGLGGRAVIEAVVAGYEAAARPAVAMHPHHTLAGFLPTGTCGAFGAAAAASRLMSQDVEGMLNALGNAGFLLPLSMAEHLMGGYTSKIVQGGQGASAGLTAAGLSGAGITGAPYALEGSQLGGGFTTITSGGQPNLEKIVEGLGKTYAIEDIYFKPYTACRHTHGGAQAALELTSHQRIDPMEIEAVDVHTYGIASIAVGKGVSAGDSFVSAQFSLPYVVAAALTDGEMGPAQLTEQRVADADLIALSQRVGVHVDQKLNDDYPEFTASRVEITFKDGRKVSRQVDVPKGDPRDPMKADDLAAKLKRFAPRKNEEVLEKIVETIGDLEKLGDIEELTSLI
ncbi:MmgE/PrpD family protein [bacterium]|nr:MmgE/PrpD family protein [bacterium]